jgi:hypothetical protein
MRQIDRGYVMTDHEAFSNWLREHEGYATAAENLSEAELYSRISRLPQHQLEGSTGPDGYEVELQHNNGESSKFPASSRKDSLVQAFLFAVYKRWADTPWDTADK